MKAAATAKTRTRFENILFATDFSASAALAIPFVKKLARHFQSNLIALHVKPPVVNPMTEPDLACRPRGREGSRQATPRRASRNFCGNQYRSAA